MPITHGVQWKTTRLRTIKDQRAAVSKILSQLLSEDPNDPELWNITPHERLMMIHRFITLISGMAEKGELERVLAETNANLEQVMQIVQNLPGIGGDEM